MKIGFDRQNTLMSCPSAIGARSTSIGAPAAMVEASGFIWEMKGQSVATPPTAAAAPVATKRKSRRVGWSAEDAVVTIPNPFLAAAGGTARGTPKADAQERDLVRLPAPATPAAAEDRLFRPRGQPSSPESFYWHPCRKSASPLSASKRAMRKIPAYRCFIHAFGVSRRMQLALFQPDIPQNTGTILRLCACLDVVAHIIEPAGFPVSDRAFRRAGMDYLDRVTLTRHVSWMKFEEWRRESGFRLVLFTTRGATSYLDFRYAASDILLFGRETVGVT